MPPTTPQDAFVRCRYCSLPHPREATVCPFTGKALDSSVAAREAPGVRGGLEGKYLGKYRVDALVGVGAMGAVYRAHHMSLRKDVALKVLLAKHPPGSNAGRRFLREARAAGQIQHENVIKLYDVDTMEDGCPYLVMELLSGESLADRLGRDGRLPVVEALDIAAQLLAGLAAAHEHGVVHRDVKPENVFLHRRSHGTQVKVLDFSISKLADTTGGLTQTGQLLGTPGYLAPEQASGDSPLDHRADLWAAGVVLYEMLTGRVPFSGSSIPELILKILGEDPAPPSTLRPSLSAAVDDLVRIALQKDPAERFPSADAMLARVDEARAERVSGELQHSGDFLVVDTHVDSDLDLGATLVDEALPDLDD